MFSPSKVTVPSRGDSKPVIVRSVVVLPAPFAPMSVTTSPFSTCIEMPRNASMAP
jgi:hypothetical protein